MRIGAVDLRERVAVVAEIGNNHEGDAVVAADLVRAAARCGADAVKLQAFATERYVARADEARFAMLSRFELPLDDYRRLGELARSLGLVFGITPFDVPTAHALAGDVDFLKIASGDNDFVPLIEAVAQADVPVVVSTGATDLDGVLVAAERLRTAWAGRDPGLLVLQCTSAYPTPPTSANLRAIPEIAAHLGCAVGFSDHTEGVDAAPVAVALGARLVEKHFTLDRASSDFRDHALSADPAGLVELIRRVRVTEALLGDGHKRVESVEEPVVAAIRRSIAAARDLPAGHVVSREDLVWLRPGGGLRPGEEAVVEGRALRWAVAAGERLALSDVEL